MLWKVAIKTIVTNYYGNLFQQNGCIYILLWKELYHLENADGTENSHTAAVLLITEYKV